MVIKDKPDNIDNDIEEREKGRRKERQELSVRFLNQDKYDNIDDDIEE